MLTAETNQAVPSSPASGAAALSALLYHFYDDDIPEAEVEAHVWGDGPTTLADLMTAAQSFGFESLLVSCNCRTLSTLSCPTIVSLGIGEYPYQHYFVVLDVDSEYVQILHPDEGVTALLLDDFVRQWQSAGETAGRALAVFPYVGCQPAARSEYRA